LVRVGVHPSLNFEYKYDNNQKLFNFTDQKEEGTEKKKKKKE